MPLVWAALWRNRTESVLTLLALSVAFALFGTMITVNAAYDRAIDDIRMDRLLIACAFDCGAIPLGYREQLARIPGVTAVGAQIWLGGRERDRHPIMVMLVDQGMRAAWPELPLSAADWRALDANPSGIFLGRQAAARRTLRAGDTVAVTTDLGSNRADGNPAWYFTVLGFVPDPPGWNSGVATRAWNQDTIVGNLSYWQNSAHADERDVVVLMRVAVDRPEHARAVCREIEARFTNATPALYCVPARDDAEETADANINMRQISLGIGAAGLFMILFLCANGVAESVRERLSEFGVLKAMGYGDGRIAAVVILEAALPTALAALIGSALARAVDALVAHLAVAGVIDMPEVHASVASIAWALALALLIALLSAVAPLYRLHHIDVAALMAGR